MNKYCVMVFCLMIITSCTSNDNKKIETNKDAYEEEIIRLNEKLILYESDIKELTEQNSNLKDQIDSQVDDKIIEISTEFFLPDVEALLYSAEVSSDTTVYSLPNQDSIIVGTISGHVEVIQKVITINGEWCLVNARRVGNTGCIGYISINDVIGISNKEYLQLDDFGIETLLIGDSVDKANTLLGRPNIRYNDEITVYYGFGYKDNIMLTIDPIHNVIRSIYIDESGSTSNGVFIGQEILEANELMLQNYNIFEEWDERILYSIRDNIVLSIRYEDNKVQSLRLHNFTDYDG